MSPTMVEFLNLRHPPACLTMDQAAALLGRRPEHIPLLVEAGLLEPLGDPPKNGLKLFALVDLQEKGKDLKWLHKANKHLTRHWQIKNGKARERHQGMAASQSSISDQLLGGMNI